MNHQVQVYGMHCKACELLIKESINELGGCTVKSISHKNGKLSVDCDVSRIPDIEVAIEKAWYSTTPPLTKASATADIIVAKIAWLLVAGVAVWFIFQTDVSRFIPAYEQLTFPIAFVVGLVASISTCLAVTWWIIVWYAESVETEKNFRTQFAFHAGRFIAFIVGGALLGLIGSQFSWSWLLNAGFSILVGVVLFYLWLQLLGVVPNISKRGFHLPGRLSKGIFKIKDPKYAPIVGALTFLLPCWFTQSMQLFALQSGSLTQWALIMWAFALGTLPVLFGIGIGVKYIKDKLTLLNPLIAAMLVAFGLYTMFNGYNLIHALSAPSQQDIVANSGDVEVVNVGFDGQYFVPETINLPVGKKYKIVVTPESNGLWCKGAVVLPWKGVQPLIKGQTFEFLVDGTSAKKIPLVCASMGMSEGEIVIK